MNGARAWRVLAINPGSTSTKVGVFEGARPLTVTSIRHTAEELAGFATIADQRGYRAHLVREAIAEAGIALADVDAFVGRGGGLAPMAGGVYCVNDVMLSDTRSGRWAKHPATLGAQIAHELASEHRRPAFIVNGPDTDEYDDLARLTGLPGLYRSSRVHALNQKEIALRYAASVGRSYESLRLVVAHLGGGISVVAHRDGRMVDAVEALGGEGPMAPTRSGAAPLLGVVEMCFSGRYTQDEVVALITRGGGLEALLGTSDLQVARDRAGSGDALAALALDAMTYQIGKSIGSMAAALRGADAIVLTGGMAHDDQLTKALGAMCEFLAPVVVLAGEFELEALAAGAIRVLDGAETAQTYTGVPIWEPSHLPACSRRSA